MTSPKSFASIGVPAHLVAALAQTGITSPTPVQEATIPELLEGHDLVAGAPTGSGKTLAFGLPLLVNLRRGRPYKPTAIVLTPTRELANQIHAVLDPLADVVGARVFAVYGGVSMYPQRAALKRGIDILVATPGRLEDLMSQQYIDLDGIEVLVIDEADRMVDVGFLPAVRRVLEATPKRQQTILFSATTDDAVGLLVAEHMPAAKRVDVQATRVDLSRTTFLFWETPAAKRSDLTAEIAKRSGRTLVFTRTKHGADRVAEQLEQRGVNATAIHGGRSQSQRERALGDFQAGRTTVLVATDVAARGIHVDDVGCVVHYDLPEVATDFTHRSGRTARAGASGVVVALVVGDKVRHMKRLARDLNRHEQITRPELAELPDAPAVVRETKAPRKTRLSQEHYEDAGRMAKTERPRREEGSWSPAGRSARPSYDRGSSSRPSSDRAARPSFDRGASSDRAARPSFDRGASSDRAARPSFDRGASSDRPARPSFDRADRPARERTARPASDAPRSSAARSARSERTVARYDEQGRPTNRRARRAELFGATGSTTPSTSAGAERPAPRRAERDAPATRAPSREDARPYAGRREESRPYQGRRDEARPTRFDGPRARPTVGGRPAGGPTGDRPAWRTTSPSDAPTWRTRPTGDGTGVRRATSGPRPAARSAATAPGRERKGGWSR